jgi:hypothetical protein
MTRFLFGLAMLAMLLPVSVWADQAEEQAPEGPRIICLGDAAAPGLLRFAFQAEPATRFAPEVLRIAERGARRAPAQRQVAPRAPTRPTLHLPCING